MGISAIVWKIAYARRDRLRQWGWGFEETHSMSDCVGELLEREERLNNFQHLEPRSGFQADFFTGTQNSMTFPHSSGGVHFTGLRKFFGM